MTAQTKAVIKSYFETGDKPTESQFADMVDSYANADLSGVTAGYLDFNTSGSSASQVGRVRWNETERCIEFDSHIDGSVVTNQVGQEIWLRVENLTGVQIDNGKAVYVNGAHGNRATIALARADSESTCLTFVGLTTQDIPNGDTGFVTILGTVHEVNTNSFSAGSILYISPTVAGSLTMTRPTPPNQVVAVGVCTVASGSGEIAVQARIQPNIEKLSNVYVVSVAGNNILQYNASTGRWENKTAVTLSEITEPSAPAANSAVIYAEDNGAGKTRLMVKFPSGAAQQIAIEP